MSMAFNSLSPSTTPRAGKTSHPIRRLTSVPAPASSQNPNGPETNHSLSLDAHSLRVLTGAACKAGEFKRQDVIFAQGVASTHVLYIQKGVVKLSVVNRAGREAIVAMLGPGDMFGEGCLTRQRVRMGTATAMTKASVLAIEKDEMLFYALFFRTRCVNTATSIAGDAQDPMRAAKVVVQVVNRERRDVIAQLF
jgi:CRP-like cAMP-binding protein